MKFPPTAHPGPATEDQIATVEIDALGRLCVRPRSSDFGGIFRAAMEVGWDPQKRCLFGVRPREWTYPTWFNQIISATADEYGVRLKLTSDTRWIDVPEEIRAKIEVNRRHVRRRPNAQLTLFWWGLGGVIPFLLLPQGGKELFVLVFPLFAFTHVVFGQARWAWATRLRDATMQNKEPLT